MMFLAAPALWIAKLLVGSGLSARAAKPLGWVGFIGIVIGALLLGWHLLKGGIIDNAMNKLRADQAEEQLERVQTADKNQAERQRAADAKDDALGKAIDDAVDTHPTEAGRSVGPASTAVDDELRRRRKASGKHAAAND